MIATETGSTQTTGEKMTQNEALALCEELRKLVGDYPGPRPEVLRRAKEIDFAFAQEPRATAYLHEKVGEVLSDLGYWCSERRWRKFGDDPARLQGQLMNSLAKLESAIRQELRGEREASESS